MQILPVPESLERTIRLHRIDGGGVQQADFSGKRGKGVGHELMGRSLSALKNMGCRQATLTVTGENEGAVRLYEQIGFRTVKRFSAFVWEF
jgi:GNAT superfamily N-acetyltransferase